MSSWLLLAATFPRIPRILPLLAPSWGGGAKKNLPETWKEEMKQKSLLAKCQDGTTQPWQRQTVWLLWLVASDTGQALLLTAAQAPRQVLGCGGEVYTGATAAIAFYRPLLSGCMP